MNLKPKTNNDNIETNEKWPYYYENGLRIFIVPIKENTERKKEILNADDYLLDEEEDKKYRW